MRRGEITGEMFNLSKEDVGMPIRSAIAPKKEERKNVSNMDDIINVDQMEQETPSGDFNYFDPSLTSYSHEINARKPNRIAKQDLRSLNDRMLDFRVQNISSYNTEYLNNISFSVFNSIAKDSYTNFCVFPISIMSSFIGHDPNIQKILSVVNTKEIFHEVKNHPSGQAILSRSAIMMNVDQKDAEKSLLYYDDNDVDVVEFPMKDHNFDLGFMTSKTESEINLTNKNFISYVSNLRTRKANVYCPAFAVSNKLHLNKTLSSLGYLPNGHLKYFQTVCLELCNNLLVKANKNYNSVDLSENFIFYIRHVPNNIVLFIGRYNF